MNLCRVLPQGTAAKLMVDQATDHLSAIGSIRDDIQRYQPHLLWHFYQLYSPPNAAW